MEHTGIDVHKKASQACIRTESGEHLGSRSGGTWAGPDSRSTPGGGRIPRSDGRDGKYKRAVVRAIPLARRRVHVPFWIELDDGTALPVEPSGALLPDARATRGRAV